MRQPSSENGGDDEATLGRRSSLFATIRIADPPDDRRNGRGAACAGELGVRLRPLSGGGTRSVSSNQETMLQRPQCKGRGRGIDRAEIDLERRALLRHPRVQQHRVQVESGRGSVKVGRGLGAQHVGEQNGVMFDRTGILFVGASSSVRQHGSP